MNSPILLPSDRNMIRTLKTVTIVECGNYVMSKMRYYPPDLVISERPQSATGFIHRNRSEKLWRAKVGPLYLPGKARTLMRCSSARGSYQSPRVIKRDADYDSSIQEYRMSKIVGLVLHVERKKQIAQVLVYYEQEFPYKKIGRLSKYVTDFHFSQLQIITKTEFQRIVGGLMIKEMLPKNAESVFRMTDTPRSDRSRSARSRRDFTLSYGAPTTEELDAQANEEVEPNYSTIIEERRKDSEANKVGRSFFSTEEARSYRLQQVAKRNIQQSRQFNSVPVPYLTDLYNQKTCLDETSSEEMEDNFACRKKRGISRIDRLLLKERESTLKDISSEVSQRCETLRFEMENDGCVFGISNYSEIRHGQLLSISDSFVLTIKTKAFKHRCYFDAIEIPTQFMHEAREFITSLPNFSKIDYFPVRTSSQNHLLIDVFINLQWVQHLLIQKGFARVVSKYPKVGIEKLIQAEEYAKSNKLGLWKSNQN